jgi:hypothetical protein
MRSTEFLGSEEEFMKQRRSGTAARIFLLALSLSTAAHASFLFTDAGSHALRYGDGFSLGSKFTVLDTNLETTALGIYDVTGSGFFQSHDVGLWDVTAGDIEVALITIPSGSSAVLVNGFRYVDLPTPLALVAGDQYILAAFYPVGEVLGVNDQMLNCCGSGSNAATDPSFGSFLAAFSTSGLGTSLGHISEPNGTTAGADYAGPNFEFQAIPEPAPLALMAFGLAALAYHRKRIRA